MNVEKLTRAAQVTLLIAGALVTLLWIIPTLIRGAFWVLLQIFEYPGVALVGVVTLMTAPYLIKKIKYGRSV